MQRLIDMKDTPSLQGFENGILRIHAYLDAHPIVAIGLGVLLLAMIFLNFWNKRRED